MYKRRSEWLWQLGRSLQWLCLSACNSDQSADQSEHSIRSIYKSDAMFSVCEDMVMPDDLSFYDCGHNQLSDETMNHIENLVFSTHTSPANTNQTEKSAGVKQAKDLGRLESVGFELNQQEATMFRALAARCN